MYIDYLAAGFSIALRHDAAGCIIPPRCALLVLPRVKQLRAQDTVSLELFLEIVGDVLREALHPATPGEVTHFGVVMSTKEIQ